MAVKSRQAGSEFLHQSSRKDVHQKPLLWTRAYRVDGLREILGFRLARRAFDRRTSGCRTLQVFEA